MTIDPLLHLREQRSKALASASHSDTTRMLANAGIEAVWSQITEGAEGLPASLTVTIGGHGQLPASAASAVAQAIQRAAAIVARGIREPTHATRLYRGDMEKAQVVQRGQSGRTLVFEVPRSRAAVDELPVEDQQGIAELSLTEIMQILPESTDDFGAMDAVLSHPVPLRLAVSDLVGAAAKTHGLEFTWRVPGSEEIHSIISFDQASELTDALRETGLERTTRRVVGRLDGMRTRRRLFYLELEEPEGSEIWGAFDAELASAVQASIDRPVMATLEVTVSVDAAGRRGRDHYRLIGLVDIDEAKLSP